MADVVRDAIAAELALVERVMPAPVEPLGYGSDISCASDLHDDMREVSGILALGEALVRRLDCPRGALPDDRSYGIALSEYLNRGTGAAELREVGAKIRGELAKDDRVASVRVTVTPSPDGGTFAVQIRVTPIDAALGPFRLVLAVTSAGVVLEEIGR